MNPSAPLSFSGRRPLRPVTPNASREALLCLPARVQSVLWRATEQPQALTPVVSSGHRTLDALLPGGGWPCGSLTEILSPPAGMLEWRLLGATWRQLAASQRPIVLVAPPHQPHLAGLEQSGITAQQLVWVQAQTAAERLWATEQILQSNDFSAVVTWLPHARPEHLRRLHLHARNTEAPVFAWRPPMDQHSPSAAPLRVHVAPGPDWDLNVHLFKRPGPVHEAPQALCCIPAPLQPLLTPRLSRPSTLRSHHLPEVDHALDCTLPALRHPIAHTAH